MILRFNCKNRISRIGINILPFLQTFKHRLLINYVLVDMYYHYLVTDPTVFLDITLDNKLNSNSHLSTLAGKISATEESKTIN